MDINCLSETAAALVWKPLLQGRRLDFISICIPLISGQAVQQQVKQSKLDMSFLVMFSSGSYSELEVFPGVMRYLISPEQSDMSGSDTQATSTGPFWHKGALTLLSVP